MTKLTSAESASLERSLALAHKYVWACQNAYRMMDDDGTADDLYHIGEALRNLLEARLKLGRPLRTRLSDRTYPYTGPARGDTPSA
jgi:hypothetical protein